MSYDLPQEEADRLLSLEKYALRAAVYDFPGPGSKIDLPLTSEEVGTDFILDINRGSISLIKCTYQTRFAVNVPLIRLDLNGPGHRNPDDTEVGESHLHLYREGFGLSWAYDIDPKVFTNPEDLEASFSDFMKYCNIVETPVFSVTLF